MKNNYWKKAIVFEEMPIIDVIKSMTNHGLQISLVVNKKKKLVGIVNDGDIRRAILNKVNLSDSVQKIMNCSPIISKDRTDSNKIIDLMKTHQIRSLPIINFKKEIIDLILLNDLTPQNIANPLVIMSGGKGTRMLPLTKNIPKSLLKINGKAILEHLLIKAANEGFKTIYISINHLGNKIEEFIKKNSIKKKLNIIFIKEKKSLGTAGSLKLIEKQVKKPIIITNGDIITDLKFKDILDFHNGNRSDATMAVKMVINQVQFGVIKNIKSKIIDLEEKPLNYSMINAGVYVLNPRVIKYIKNNNKMDMTELFTILLKKNYKINAFPIHEKWSDVGNKKDYIKLK